MSSSDEAAGAMPPGDGSVPPGKSMSIGQHVIDKGAQLMQSFKPIKQMSQHVCTFAMYSHDITRQIETHHYLTRLNQDFLQCPVYDSDDSKGRLIGIEYIISDRIFETLPAEEQKLWHSHEYEIIAGLWVNPRVPEMIQKQELKNIAPTYGKFWCTWQVDRGYICINVAGVGALHRKMSFCGGSGDRVPLGAPALMMSPQGVNLGMVAPELVKKRDEKYGISSKDLEKTRMDIAGPERTMNPYANYWMQTGKGFAIDVELTDMKKTAPFP